MSVKKFVLYKGPSMLSKGRDIVAILRTAGNTKTGKKEAWGLWIIPLDIGKSMFNKDVPPGSHMSVCGSCPLGGSYTLGGDITRLCYVNAQGVNALARSYFKSNVNGGFYEAAKELERNPPNIVRVGSWGDGAALPTRVLKKLFKLLKKHKVGHTAYTHQWRVDARKVIRQNFMASVHNQEEREQANSKGFRVFGVGEFDGATLCPASEEAGKRSTCAQCKLCDGGTVADSRRDIYIPPHGIAKKRFKTLEV